MHATPVSAQARRRVRIHEWKAEVRAFAEARRDEIAPGFLPDTKPVAATIIYFADAQLVGDVDNIVKPILDALKTVAYQDDGQVERVIVQKVEPQMDCLFLSPSEMLTKAMTGSAPALYIRVDADLVWRSIE